MLRSHGDNLTGKRHYSKDPVSDNAPDQSAWVGCHPDHSSRVGCRPKEWSATYHGNYSGYHNSGSTTSYVPDACTGSDSDRAAPIAEYLADGEDADEQAPAQCTHGNVTTAAVCTGSKNKCAAPITTSTPIAKPAAECIQTNGDEDFLDCVGKPSFPLAMTAAEYTQTFGCEFPEGEVRQDLLSARRAHC